MKCSYPEKTLRLCHQAQCIGWLALGCCSTSSRKRVNQSITTHTLGPADGRPCTHVCVSVAHSAKLLTNRIAQRKLVKALHRNAIRRALNTSHVPIIVLRLRKYYCDTKLNTCTTSWTLDSSLRAMHIRHTG
jgi:hypothetical protein